MKEARLAQVKFHWARNWKRSEHLVQKANDAEMQKLVSINER